MKKELLFLSLLTCTALHGATIDTMQDTAGPADNNFTVKDAEGTSLHKEYLRLKEESLQHKKETLQYDEALLQHQIDLSRYLETSSNLSAQRDQYIARKKQLDEMEPADGESTKEIEKYVGEQHEDLNALFYSIEKQQTADNAERKRLNAEYKRLRAERNRLQRVDNQLADRTLQLTQHCTRHFGVTIPQGFVCPSANEGYDSDLN